MSEFAGFHYMAGRGDSAVRPLLLLHGSGGNETDLLALADQVASRHPYIALRGGVSWEGGFAFFRRNPDRSLDYDDLALQTARLCSFIETAREHALLRDTPILLGFSNGAIMASSVLRLRPDLAQAAILLRPLSPAPDAIFPPMPEHRILIVAGSHDQRRASGDAVLMREQFENAGADVSSYLLPTGHGLHETEVHVIGDWIVGKVFGDGTGDNGQ